MKRKKSSLLSQYIISYILVLMVPMIIVFVFTYYTVFDMLEREVLTNHADNLSLAVIQIENETSFATDDLTLIHLKENFTSFDFIREHDIAIDTQDELKNYLITSNLIVDIALYQKSSEYIITAYGSAQKSQFFNTMYAYENWSLEQFENDIIINKEAFTHNSDLIYGGNLNEGVYTTFVIPLNKSFTRCLLFIIDSESFENYFSKSNLSYNFIFDDNGELIYSTKDYPFELADLNDDNQTSNSSEIETSHGNYYKIEEKSDKLGWTLMTLTPVDYLLESLTFMQITFFVIFVFAILLSLLLIYFFVKKNYLPVKHLLNSLPAIPEQSDDRNEIGKVENVLNYLNEKNEEMTIRLKEELNDASYLFVQKLFNGQYDDENYVKTKANSLDFNLHVCDNYLICVVSFSNGTKVFSDVIKDIFQSNLPNEINLICLHQSENERTLLSFSGEALVTLDLFSYFTLCCQQIKKDTGRYVTVGVSNSVNSVCKWKIGVNQAIASCEYNIIYGDIQPIFYKDITNSKTTSFSFKATELNEALEKLNSSEVRRVIDEMKLDLINSKYCVSEAKQFCYHLIDSTVSWLNKENLKNSSGQNFEVSAIRNIAYSNIYDLTEQLNKIILHYIPLIKKNKNYDKLDIVTSFIAENYCDCDFSALQVSEKFGMTPANLSRYFKNSTGENIANYITGLRIEKAKELLKNTELSINEISNKVGYYNSNSFTRRFKQVTGMTPGQFRTE